MLEDGRIAGHQGGCGEAEHLPEGEVPRHHGEDRAERLEANVTPGGVRLARLLGEKGLGVVRVVLTARGALIDFGLGLNDRLAHLEGHRARVLSPARSKDARGFAHPLRPRREGCRPPLEKRRVRGREESVEVFSRGFLEGLQDVAGRGIDGLDAHRVFLMRTVLKKALTSGSEYTP